MGRFVMKLEILSVLNFVGNQHGLNFIEWTQFDFI